MFLNKSFLIVLSVLGILFLQSIGGLSLVHAEDAGTEHPNVLMLFVDDLNIYAGSMVHPNAITPNLDRLAREGILFTEAYCQAPICGPSRASIMLGMRPSTTGIYGQIRDESIRSASEVTRYSTYLPEYFKEHGYHTMGVGKLFHEHAPAGTFDESGGRKKGFGPKPKDGSHFKWKAQGTSTDWGAYPETDEEMPDVQSAEWAVERLQRSYTSPFFMAVGFLRPHVPWYVPQKWFDHYKIDEIVTPPWRADDFDDIPEIAKTLDTLPMMPTTEWAIENNEWRNILHAYLACVTFVDAQVGKILQALDESPYKDNTIVVLLSDHGYRLGEKGTFAKNCLWREATQVPLVFAGNGLKGGIRVSQPVELIDIYPTLLDLANLPANTRLDGHNLSGRLHGQEETEPGKATVSYGRNNHALRMGRYYFIQYEDGSEELYNIEKDPHCFINLAKQPASQSALEDLRAALPQRNRNWSPDSESDWPDFLVEQSRNQLGEYDFYPDEVLRYCEYKILRALNNLDTTEAQPATIPAGHKVWETKPADKWAWTHGFWPGILWYGAEWSDNSLLYNAAREYTESLGGILASPPRSHDLGFIFNTSYGNAWRLTGEKHYAEVLIRAADRLMGLYNPAVGAVLAWPNKVKNGDFAPFNVIIDSMLNMELLFQASRITGDLKYANAAISHADKVMENHVREDGSSYHVVVFDDKTGKAKYRTTHQGYASDSVWARGQAWGIYGFAMCYRETGNGRYLHTATRMADYFMKRLPDDTIPYWDFDDPAIPNAPRDASAAAIAASGMLEIAHLAPADMDIASYLNAAASILRSLSTEPYRSFSEKDSFIDHSTGNRPSNREVDVPIIYGDYYFLEALLRLKTSPFWDRNPN